MNFLMIMGFLGLFTLTMTAAPLKGHSDTIPAPSASAQRTLQQQLNDISLKYVELQERQKFLYGEQTQYNCRLGVLEAKPSTNFKLIEGPDGLYMQKDGKLHLLENKKTKSAVAEIFEEPAKKELAVISQIVADESEGDNPDQNKIKKSDIFVETSMDTKDLEKSAENAALKAEVAKTQVIESINKGNSEIEKIECNDSSDTDCKARLDNHRPMPKENLKEYTIIKKEDEEGKYYSDTLDEEYQRAFKRTSYAL